MSERGSKLAWSSLAPKLPILSQHSLSFVSQEDKTMLFYWILGTLLVLKTFW